MSQPQPEDPNPYRSPAEGDTGIGRKRPSTGCLRYGLAGVFGYFGLSLIVEGGVILTRNSIWFGSGLIVGGAFIVFVGWYAFLHRKP